MKPFNLELWKAGEPVITRDGSEVKELTYFETMVSKYKLFGTTNGELHNWNDSGQHYDNGTSRYDLFHPEPEMWVNLFKTDYSRWTGRIFNTKKEAEEFAERESDAKHIGTFKLVR